MKTPVLTACAVLMLAGCSQTLPEGWDSVEAVKADLGTHAFGYPDNRWVPSPSVSVSAPLSCASGFDPRDSFEELRQQANATRAPDGLAIVVLPPHIPSETIRAYLAQEGIRSASGHGMTVVQSTTGHSHHDVIVANDLSAKEQRDALLHELDHVMCGRRDE